MNEHKMLLYVLDLLDSTISFVPEPKIIRVPVLVTHCIILKH